MRTRLRELRLDRRLSLEEVADAVGLSKMAVSRHERGDLELSASAVSRYTELYRVRPRDLFTCPAQERAAVA